jgi:hypothetical protein
MAGPNMAVDSRTQGSHSIHERTDGTQSSSTSRLPAFAAAVAVALIVLYLVFVVLQWRSVGAQDLTYARHSELLKGLEALAFAAAGAILGTTVQRQVTKKAEADAEVAKQETKTQMVRADANEAAAEKGRALHNLARAKAAARPSARVRGLGEESAGTDVDDFLYLADQYDAHLSASGSAR